MDIKTKIIAHRGFSGKYPENTMLAFKKAYEAGADGIELDVHLTSDGEVIICHDEEIDRTSDGHGYIKDLTLKEIKNHRFLNGMDKVEFESEEDIKAPTLNEFMEWFRDTGMIVNIELKNNIFRYPGIVEKVLGICKEYGVSERVIISSFNHHAIKDVKAADETIRCGFLTASSILEPGNYTRYHGAECYHPLFISLAPEDFKNLKDNGIEINTWTVNEEEHMEPLMKIGTDGIITNFPDKAIELNKKLTEKE